MASDIIANELVIIPVISLNIIKEVFDTTDIKEAFKGSFSLNKYNILISKFFV